MSTGNRGRVPAGAFDRRNFDDNSVVGRVRRGLAEAGLDCECRETANAVLDRIGQDGDRATRLAALTEARKMRDAVLIVVTLLGELDEITIDEPDRTTFDEMAALFRDLSDFASHGAECAMIAGATRAHGH